VIDEPSAGSKDDQDVIDRERTQGQVLEQVDEGAARERREIGVIGQFWRSSQFEDPPPWRQVVADVQDSNASAKVGEGTTQPIDELVPREDTRTVDRQDGRSLGQVTGRVPPAGDDDRVDGRIARVGVIRTDGAAPLGAQAVDPGVMVSLSRKCPDGPGPDRAVNPLDMGRTCSDTGPTTRW
jgi:hypothetical protein